MLAPLRPKGCRRLFAAEVASLLGAGLTTVALALLAFDLAGAPAGAVLGTALAPKMVACVAIAPLAGAVAAWSRGGRCWWASISCARRRCCPSRSSPSSGRSRRSSS